eukprot:6179881-Karenia_brevis.AAC.1
MITILVGICLLHEAALDAAREVWLVKGWDRGEAEMKRRIGELEQAKSDLEKLKARCIMYSWSWTLPFCHRHHHHHHHHH